MADEAHVGLVDAHAEGDGRDHHDAVLLQESVLVAAARALVHAGVVGERAHAAPAEVLGEGLGAQARGAIDDAAFALVAGDELGELAARLVLRLEAERDVRPVERVQEDARPALEQALGDVLARRLVGGRREGEGLDVAERPAGATDRAVLGAEIVPPLRHAMRLVDGEPPDAGVAQARRQALGLEPLRRDEEQAQLLFAQEPPGLARLVVAGRGVEGRCGDAEAAHLLHLVAHQRDQRRHDDGERAVDDRRQLVAHRLAGAGRHHGKHVLAGEHGGDDLGLAGAEIAVAEDRSERRARGCEPVSQRRRPRAAAGRRRACRRAGRGGSACPGGRSPDLGHDGEAGERQRAGETRAAGSGSRTRSSPSANRAEADENGPLRTRLRSAAAPRPGRTP